MGFIMLIEAREGVYDCCCYFLLMQIGLEMSEK